jgi:hypothetical protein
MIDAKKADATVTLPPPAVTIVTEPLAFTVIEPPLEGAATVTDPSAFAVWVAVPVETAASTERIVDPIEVTDGALNGVVSATLAAGGNTEVVLGTVSLPAWAIGATAKAPVATNSASNVRLAILILLKAA